MQVKIEDIHSKYLIGPHQLSLDITNKCNLRCLHCYNYSGENTVIENELTDNEILENINSFIPFQLFNMCFCGGEPLLRKSLITECSKILTSNGVQNISMVTNGTLLSKETLEELVESGVNRIQISLDGAKAESHDRLRNKKGVFEKATAALRLLATTDKINYTVAFTPTSFNINELEDVFNFLKSLGKQVDLRVQPLMMLGRANDNLEKIIPSQDQYRCLIRKINQLKGDPIVHIIWGDPVDHLVRFTNRSIPYNHCNIRANGDITVSPYIPLVVGNLRKHTLKEYWDAGLYKVWTYNLSRIIAGQIKSIHDMQTTQQKIHLFKEDDLRVDLIDDDLNDLSILEEVNSKAKA